MKSFRFARLIMAVVFVVAFLPGQTVVAQPPHQEIDPAAKYVPGEAVVMFPEGQDQRVTHSKAMALAGQVGATVANQYGNVALLSVDPDADVAALVAQIQSTGLKAGPNYVYSTAKISQPTQTSPTQTSYTEQMGNGQEYTLTPEILASLRHKVVRNYRVTAVPLFPNEFFNTNTDSTWGWNATQADIIWPNAAVSPTVCLLDTGADGKHPDLAGKVINGYDFFNMDSVANDDNGHGTFVAGVISAKVNNGVDTALGVSNGQVLAVKVADANGNSTSYQLAAGIRYCAGNLSTKIINMSMGTNYPDYIIYINLEYAINTKGKLVVAAAGDDYRSAMGPEYPDRELPPFYPAGWADKNVGWTPDMWVAYNPDGNEDTPDNDIYQGLISVAAANNPKGGLDNGDPFWTWVDTNENGEKDEGENFAGQIGCRNFKSNYGRWVSMVAPGSLIYSDTPVSYPFAWNFYDGWSIGYGWGSGTSVGAGFVSGAAARAWSVNATAKAWQIKNLLISSGDPLSGWAYVGNLLAVDEGIPDPTNVWALFNANEVYGWFNNDPNRWDDEERLPFCWPTVEDDDDDNTNPFQAPEDMSNATYLNVAAAINCFSLSVPVRDALTGMPLAGATVQLKNKATGVVADKAIVSASPDFPNAYLINLPYKEGTTYQFQVNKPGYTNGTQTFWEMTIDHGDPLGTPINGCGWVDEYSPASIPPLSSNLTAVLDWMPYWGYDLDLSLWLPKGPVTNASEGAMVLHNPLIWEYQTAYDIYPDPDNSWKGDIWVGTLMDPATIGALDYAKPYAQHNFERGDDGRATTESITIKTKLGKPWYTGDYTFLVGDTSSSYPDGLRGDWPNRLDIDNVDFAYPVVRLWMGGVLKKTSALDYHATDQDCYDNEGVNADFWKALVINGTTYTASQECGTGEWPRQPHTIFPYP